MAPFRTHDTAAQAETITPSAPVTNWFNRARRTSPRVFPPSPLPVDSFLPLLLSYGYYGLPQRSRYIPGFLRHRVPEYNRVDPNSYTRRLQDLHLHTTSFSPPPFRDLRLARPIVSSPRHGPRQCLSYLLFLSVISHGVSHLPRACPRLALLPQFRTPPEGYFCPREAGRSTLVEVSHPTNANALSTLIRL